MIRIAISHAHSPEATDLPTSSFRSCAMPSESKRRLILVLLTITPSMAPRKRWSAAMKLAF